MSTHNTFRSFDSSDTVAILGHVVSFSKLWCINPKWETVCSMVWTTNLSTSSAINLVTYRCRSTALTSSTILIVIVSIRLDITRFTIVISSTNTSNTINTLSYVGNLWFTEELSTAWCRSSKIRFIGTTTSTSNLTIVTGGTLTWVKNAIEICEEVLIR